MKYRMSETNKSIKINVIWNTILSLSLIIFPFITFPYITRVLGVEVNGIISFSSATINYFSLFATLGLTTYGVKACAQVKDNSKELSKVVHELLMISSVAAIIVLTLLYCLCFWIPKFRQCALFIVVYSINIIGNVIGINWMYQGIEKYKYVTTRSIAFKIISILMMFLLVHDPEDGIWYAVVSVFAVAGGNLYNFIHARKYISFKRLDNYNWKRHIAPLMILFATNLAVNVYSNLDTVMLGFIQNDYATGIYTVAVKIKTILLTLVSSFSLVIMSRLSYVKTKQNADNNQFLTILKKSYSVIVMITIPLVIFFIMFAKESILILSGKDFVEATEPMVILMPTIVLSALSQIIGSQYSVSIGKEKNLMIAVICGAIMNVICNACLIPKYSYNGAAVGTLIAEFTQFFIQIFLALNMVRKVFALKKICQVVVCTLISTILIKVGGFTELFIAPIWNIIICGCIFFGSYFVELYIAKFDILYDMIKVIRTKIGR